MNELGGFRLNNYTSLIVFLGALAVFVWLVRNRPGREAEVEGPVVADAAVEKAPVEGRGAGRVEGRGEDQDEAPGQNDPEAVHADEHVKETPDPSR